METDFIFHEVYGVYYRTVAKIINRMLNDDDNDFSCGKTIGLEEVMDIIAKTAFKESLGETSPSSNLLAAAIDCNRYKGVIDAKVKNGNVVYGTTLKHLARMPLTLLEKRWLKTISADPRIRLFDCKFPDLIRIEPLYDKADIHYCGQYYLGDDYESEEYITIFRTINKAIKEHYRLRISYISPRDGLIEGLFEPQRLQYSIKEDRFRLFALKDGVLYTINLSRIISCESESKVKVPSPHRYLETSYVEIIINNNRRTLERFLLYFSNYERRTTNLGNGVFDVKIVFPKQDETEVLVNILSYIPMVRVIAPEEMKDKFMQRIQKQKELWKEITLKDRRKP